LAPQTKDKNKTIPLCCLEPSPVFQFPSRVRSYLKASVSVCMRMLQPFRAVTMTHFHCSLRKSGNKDLDCTISSHEQFGPVVLLKQKEKQDEQQGSRKINK